MKKLVPLFSEYNSQRGSFYFDRKINEAGELPLVMSSPQELIKTPTLIQPYIDTPNMEQKLNCFLTIMDSRDSINAIKSNSNSINDFVTKLVTTLIDAMQKNQLLTLRIMDAWYFNLYLTLRDHKFELDSSLKAMYVNNDVPKYNDIILDSKNINELKGKIFNGGELNVWQFLNFLHAFAEEGSYKRIDFLKNLGSSDYKLTSGVAVEIYNNIIEPAKKQISAKYSEKWIYTPKQYGVIEWITGTAGIKVSPSNTTNSNTAKTETAKLVKTADVVVTANKSTSPKKTTSLKDSAKTYPDSPISQLFKDAGVVESFRRMFVNEEDTENSGGKLLRTEIDRMDATDIYNKLSKIDKTFILPSDGNINQMNADDLCYRFIATFEGYTEGVKKDELVTDREVYQTGFGVVVPKDSSGVSSKAEAMDLLVKYCNQRITPKFREWVKKYRYVLNQNMINGLYSFAYNLGEGKLEKLTNGTSTPAGPRNEITLPYGMKLYTKASGKGNLGLKWRREAEVAMYNGEIKDESSFNSFMSTRNKMTLMTTSGDSKIEKAELAKAELKAPGEMPQQLSPELGGNTPSMKP